MTYLYDFKKVWGTFVIIYVLVDIFFFFFPSLGNFDLGWYIYLLDLFLG